MPMHGTDARHMLYDRVAQGQAVPPAFTRVVWWLVLAQLCMRLAEQQFGVPAISFDEMVSRPSTAARKNTKYAYTLYAH